MVYSPVSIPVVRNDRYLSTMFCIVSRRSSSTGARFPPDPLRLLTTRMVWILLRTRERIAAESAPAVRLSVDASL